MTISKPNLVRLLGAVFGVMVSAWFVVLYTRFSRFRFEIEHHGGQLTRFNADMSAYAGWLFAFPVLALALGLLLLLARPGATTAFEIVLALCWLLAFTLPLFCILSWQVNNVPTFSHMEWHF